MTLFGTHTLMSGRCTIHGPYAGIHCPTCVTFLTPPASAVPLLPPAWGWASTGAAQQPTTVIYPAATDATAPTTPTIE